MAGVEEGAVRQVVRFICTRPETTLARYRRVFITFIFIQFSNLAGHPVLRHAYSYEGDGWSGGCVIGG